jgi:hypothetical protein
MSAIRFTLMLIAVAWIVAVGWYYILTEVSSSLAPHHPRPQVEMR